MTIAGRPRAARDPSSRRVVPTLLLWAPPLVQMLAIFMVSGVSEVPAVPGGISDKALHAIVYGVLSGLWLRALAGGRRQGVTSTRTITAVALSAGYGITDELHQAFVPSRHAELADVFADALGAAGGALIAWSILARVRGDENLK